MAFAVIVAAGRGTRMGSDKLFLEVGGLPVVGHSWKRFDAHPDIERVVLVVRPDNRASFEGLASRLGLTRPYTCLLYTSPSPRDQRGSRMPSSA